MIQLDPAEVGFDDIRGKPYVIKVCDGKYGAAGLHHFTLLGAFDQYIAIDGTVEVGIAEIYFGDFKRGDPDFQFGLGHFKFVFG